MRIGSTAPVIYLTGQSRKATGQTCLDMYLGRLVAPWSLVLFPGCYAIWFFHRHCSQHYYVLRARKMRKRPQPAHGQLATPVALIDHRVHSTSDPTSELVFYAVPDLGKQPSWAASAVASPQLRRWICQQGLRSARMRCLLLVIAAASAAAVLLLLLPLLLRRRLLFLLFYIWSLFVLNSRAT